MSFSRHYTLMLGMLQPFDCRYSINSCQTYYVESILSMHMTEGNGIKMLRFSYDEYIKHVHAHRLFSKFHWCKTHLQSVVSKMDKQYSL